MVDPVAEVLLQGQGQQTRTLARPIVVPKRGIAVKIGLVERPVCDPAVAGNAWDLDIQIPLEGHVRNTEMYEVHPDDTHGICESGGIAISAAVASNQENEHSRRSIADWRRSRSRHGGDDCQGGRRWRGCARRPRPNGLVCLEAEERQANADGEDKQRKVPKSTTRELPKEGLLQDI